jgi:HrpA-like RNA helicase
MSSNPRSLCPLLCRQLQAVCLPACAAEEAAGDVLVFLPGQEEIDNASKILEARVMKSPAHLGPLQVRPLPQHRHIYSSRARSLQVVRRPCVVAICGGLLSKWPRHMARNARTNPCSFCSSDSVRAKGLCPCLHRFACCPTLLSSLLLLPQICPLFASLSPEAQLKAFEPTLPGHRKVILSTNIAETGGSSCLYG